MKPSGGYIGLITLLIAVAIIAILSVKMYGSSFKTTNPSTETDILSPIEKAEEAKAQIENRQPNPTINIKPETIYPGDPVLITIDAKSKPTSILWDNKNIPVFVFEGKSRALVPVDFNEKIFTHKVTAKLEDGEILAKEVTITPRKKIEKPLGIPEKLGGDTPQAAQDLLKNLASENYILNTLKSAPTTLWTKSFQYPLSNIFITDDYGYSRKTVNQTITHKGTDFRAGIGTEVRAMNKGVVKIARNFTVYGNTVVVDHGLGVQTLYMHLSKLNVKEGNTVNAGDIIGWSGDSGYADSPHLHISVKINGISIDPITFLKLF